MPFQLSERSNRLLEAVNFFLCAAALRSQAFDHLSQINHAPLLFAE